MRGSKSEDEMTAEIIANAESICRSSLFLFLYHQQYLVEEHLSSLVFVRPGAALDCLESFIPTTFMLQHLDAAMTNAGVSQDGKNCLQ